MDGICMPVCDVNKLSCNLNALDFSFIFFPYLLQVKKVIKLWHWINKNCTFTWQFFISKFMQNKKMYFRLHEKCIRFVTWIQLHINLYLSVVSYFIIDINFCTLFRTQIEWKTIFREIYLKNTWIEN